MQQDEILKIKQRYGIITNDPQMHRAIEVAAKAATTDLTVLITGENGTGKEFFPKIIHDCSRRKGKKFLPINCGGLPPGTIESELFGHVKGAFTSAFQDHKGYFEACDGGTIFLDEIGEMPMNIQAKLLRVLETGDLIRMGSTEPVKVDVRVVAATNVDLRKAIRDGKFREDLYYRLNTINISVPPLRERKDDILMLFRKFEMDYIERYQRPSYTLSHDAKEMMRNFYWSGNVRQLRNVTEQLSLMETAPEISADTLAKYLPHNEAERGLILMHGQGSSADGEFRQGEREMIFQMINSLRQELAQLREQLYGAAQGVSPVAPVSVGTSAPQDDNQTEWQEVEEVKEGLQTMEETERKQIRLALEQAQGNRKEAARILGMSERTFYRKIKKYKL